MPGLIAIFLDENHAGGNFLNSFRLQNWEISVILEFCMEIEGDIFLPVIELNSNGVPIYSDHSRNPQDIEAGI